MLLETLCVPPQLAFSADQSTSSFTALVPQTAKPTGSRSAPNGIISFGADKDGILQQNGIKIIPFGQGSDANTLSVRISGWSVLHDTAAGGLDLWVPINLIECQGTLETGQPGVAGTLIGASDFFCDTITVTTGSTLSGEAAAENIVSPANGTIAHLTVDVRGFQIIQIQVSTGGSASAVNCLWSFL